MLVGKRGSIQFTVIGREKMSATSSRRRGRVCLSTERMEKKKKRMHRLSTAFYSLCREIVKGERKRKGDEPFSFSVGWRVGCIRGKKRGKRQPQSASTVSRKRRRGKKKRRRSQMLFAVLSSNKERDM